MQLSVVTNTTGIELKTSNWRMRQLTEWFDYTKTVNIVGINKMMATIITTWDFVAEDGSKLDPSNVESYLELLPSQWKKCLETISTEVTKTFLS